MDQNDLYKDWYFRYNHLYNLRNTSKQRDRFIGAFIKDVTSFRNDIRVIEARNEKGHIVSRNIYIGNIKKAETIIATYYDTPSVHFGSYIFNNIQSQRNKTVAFNVTLSIVLILLGLLFMTQLAIPTFRDANSFRLIHILVLAVMVLILMLIAKSAKGLPRRKNVIRNNSSILTILSLIKESKAKKVAFALVDTGTTNNYGVKALLERMPYKSRVYYLDSIGSNNPLYIVSRKLQSEISNMTPIEEETIVDERLNIIISADRKDGQLRINKKSLNKTEMNESNIKKVKSFLRQKI